MKPKTLFPFFALTFGLTWGLGALLFLFPDQLTALFGEVSDTNPLFILAVYSPAIAAFILVIRHEGMKGLGSFLRRLTLWRASIAWWLVLVLGIPLMYYAGAAIKGGPIGAFPFSPWYEALPALALALVIGPIEEFGWRGLALPLLQRRFAPFWAGLILGLIWAVWHLPAFLIGGTPQSAMDFAPFFLAAVSVCMILTAMFNASRGSLLIAALFHFQLNNPIWPDAQPYDTIIFFLAAVAVIALTRKSMFQKGSGVTEVLYPEEVVRIVSARDGSSSTGQAAKII